MPAPSGKDDGGKGNQGGNEDFHPTMVPTLPAGTFFSDRSDFVKQMQAAGCTIAKEVTPIGLGPWREVYSPVGEFGTGERPLACPHRGPGGYFAEEWAFHGPCWPWLVRRIEEH